MDRNETILLFYFQILTHLFILSLKKTVQDDLFWTKQDSKIVDILERLECFKSNFWSRFVRRNLEPWNGVYEVVSVQLFLAPYDFVANRTHHWMSLPVSFPETFASVLISAGYLTGFTPNYRRSNLTCDNWRVSVNPSVPDSLICAGAKLAHFGLWEVIARDQ